MQKNSIELLCNKVQNEYDEFIDELKSMTSEQIIDRAYEKVIKENIVMVLRQNELTHDEAEALLHEDNPLDLLYCEWLYYDSDETQILTEYIEGFAQEAARKCRECMEKVNALYWENPVGGDEWFYHHPERQEFEAVYFNPDSNAGGQYVIMTLPYELICDIYNRTNDATSFFDCLEEEAARTVLVDITDDAFKSNMEIYQHCRADFIGRTVEIMDSLVKTATKNL